MEPAQAQALISLIGGGLAGGILTIAYNWFNAKQRAQAQERATIAALFSELRCSQCLCGFNTLGKAPKPFVPLPNIVAERVAFGDRHNYPRLEKFQKAIEQYTLALLQVNQLISLYRLLLASGKSENQDVVRRIDGQIVSICQGKPALDIGNLNLPTSIANLISDLEKLSGQVL